MDKPVSENGAQDTNWRKGAILLVAGMLTILLGMQLISYVAVRQTASVVDDIRKGLEGPLDERARPAVGSQILFDGDSIGSIIAVVRSPRSTRADSVVLISAVDSSLRGMKGLTGHMLAPIQDGAPVVVTLRTAADTSVLRQVAQIRPANFDAPIDVFIPEPR